MQSLTSKVAQNLADIRGRIASAAGRSGRQASDVCLIAVTKYVGLAEIRALVEAGCTVLGESRPQQLWDRAEALGNLAIEWHFIGHLQRNKVRRTLPLVKLVHSIDSLRLAAALDEAATEASRRIPILLEVNVSREVAKQGFTPQDLEPALAVMAGYQHIEVRGLMCMAGLEGGLDEARQEFALLRQLRERLAGRCPPDVDLRELSMGMSGDYEVAIEEGATMVRVGSALFEGIGL